MKEKMIGSQVEKSTTFLKKVSDYIETKLYDKDGNVNQSGVKSLSLTFAMLVGFSFAILVLSSVFISMIVSHKNSVISEVKTSQEKIDKRNIELEKKIDYWKERYSNVYSQCDSIGYDRAKKALEFSQSLNNKLSLEESNLRKQKAEKVIEEKDLKKLDKEITDIKERITLNKYEK